MDLTTLIAACALMVDPKVMHALIWQQSGGEPWAFTVSGQQQPQVLRSLRDAVNAARDTTPSDALIRIGLAGLPATPRSVTPAMFIPCFNISSAASRLVQLTQRCNTSSRTNGDPTHCAVAAYHGSWDQPDNTFADAIHTTVVKNDAPDFEMPAETEVDPDASNISSDPASHQTEIAPESPAPSTSNDYQRARESPLFPVLTSSEHKEAHDPSAPERQKTDVPESPSRGTPSHHESLFVHGPAQGLR